MPQPALSPLRLKEMRPTEVEAAIAHDPRLLVPVGACEPHGRHLPIGCDTMIAERLCDDLSAELRILRAPTVEYGVMTPSGRPAAGSTGLRRKTLLRQLNDLTELWEDGGIREFVLVTAHGHDGHIEALSTVITRSARVQAVDVLSIRFPELRATPGPQDACEAETSLLLFLAPDLVADPVAAAAGGQPVPPTAAPFATAAIGEAIYRRIKRLVRDRVLNAPPDDEP